MEGLPVNIQRTVYEEVDPILLKCHGSPHIYLLENGQKHWIDSIETFEEQGYLWRHVHFVSCGDIRAVPDGASIPVDAVPPPQPWP